MEKIRSLVGMVSKKKFFSACKCYENNKYGVDYVKPQLCIDEESHLIFCDRHEANAPLVDDDGSRRVWAEFECKEYKHE